MTLTLPRHSLLTMIGLLLLAAVGGPNAMARQEDDPHMDHRRTISVTGTGRLSAAPDLADINIGVVSQAQTARDALAANTEAMTAVQALLKERGVAAKDIQTTNINIQPRYSQPTQPQPGQKPVEYIPRIVGYDVNNTVQITARDITKLGTILDAVVGSGANRMDGISFRIDDSEKLMDQARKQAVADARRKAEQIAGELGVVLGPPVSVQESSGYQPPMPRRGAMMRMAVADAAPVPVAAGEQEIAVSLSVVYEITPAK